MPCTSHSSIVKDSSANAAHVGVGSPVVSDKPSEDARRHKIQVEAACVGLWIQTSPAIGFGRLSEDNPLELSQDLTRLQDSPESFNSSAREDSGVSSFLEYTLNRTETILSISSLPALSRTETLLSITSEFSIPPNLSTTSVASRDAYNDVSCSKQGERKVIDAFHDGYHPPWSSVLPPGHDRWDHGWARISTVMKLVILKYKVVGRQRAASSCIPEAPADCVEIEAWSPSSPKTTPTQGLLTAPISQTDKRRLETVYVPQDFAAEVASLGRNLERLSFGGVSRGREYISSAGETLKSFSSCPGMTTCTTGPSNNSSVPPSSIGGAHKGSSKPERGKRGRDGNDSAGRSGSNRQRRRDGREPADKKQKQSKAEDKGHRWDCPIHRMPLYICGVTEHCPESPPCAPQGLPIRNLWEHLIEKHFGCEECGNKLKIGKHASQEPNKNLTRVQHRELLNEAVINHKCEKKCDCSICHATAGHCKFGLAVYDQLAETWDVLRAEITEDQQVRRWVKTLYPNVNGLEEVDWAYGGRTQISNADYPRITQRFKAQLEAKVAQDPRLCGVTSDEMAAILELYVPSLQSLPALKKERRQLTRSLQTLRQESGDQVEEALPITHNPDPVADRLRSQAPFGETPTSGAPSRDYGWDQLSDPSMFNQLDPGKGTGESSRVMPNTELHSGTNTLGTFSGSTLPPAFYGGTYGQIHTGLAAIQSHTPGAEHRGDEPGAQANHSAPDTAFVSGGSSFTIGKPSCNVDYGSKDEFDYDLVVAKGSRAAKDDALSTAARSPFSGLGPTTSFTDDALEQLIDFDNHFDRPS